MVVLRILERACGRNHPCQQLPKPRRNQKGRVERKKKKQSERAVAASRRCALRRWWNKIIVLMVGGVEW